jgi:hypothetical protein
VKLPEKQHGISFSICVSLVVASCLPPKSNRKRSRVALQVPNSDGESYSCISGIIPGGDASQIILGDNFLRAWYTVYKYDTSTKNAYVGFARSVDAAAPTDAA